MVDSESDGGSFLKDLAVAVIVIAGFVAALPVPVVQVPGYLLLRGFDALGGLVPGIGGAFGLEVVVFLLGLAGVAAAVARPLRELTTARPWFRAPVVAALLVVGAALLAVAAGIAAAGEGAESLAVAVGAAVVVLGLASIAQGLGRRRAETDADGESGRSSSEAAPRPDGASRTDGSSSTAEQSETREE